MAKRRKITAPSADDLSRIEEEFRRETIAPAPQARAPISQIAAEAASTAPVLGAEERVEMARDKTDAKDMRQARQEGRVLQEIPLDAIDDTAMIRDRTVLDPDKMNELQVSISMHGLRLPIEVYELESNTPKEPKYGLLSGYRRFHAIKALQQVDAKKYTNIKAIVRDPEALGGAFTAMVEENEVRANLSHYERGRIAVIAAQQGAFTSLENAVNGLFAAASKAKRSKIRSFAAIHEDLGDALVFPEALKERQGLRLASALRNGAEARLREALAADRGTTPEREWDIIEAICAEIETNLQDPQGRAGRPKAKPPAPGWQDDKTLHLSSGITLQRLSDSAGHAIRIKGRGVNDELIEHLMQELQLLLEKSQ